ncbi:MAG: hypothetical protein GOV02_00555 [Candidatus Aenigmarchaeota archaeon]|nr:hypothetical protein [Candidatus Aenigmarchaeota archaeon]
MGKKKELKDYKRDAKELRAKLKEVTGPIIKNKVTKTAEIDMTMYMNDSTEEESMLGDMSMMPTALNMTCYIFVSAFFNPDAWDDAEMTSDTENKLEGYDVTRFEFNVVDEEDGNKISSCIATSKDDVRFNMFRDY